MEEKHLGYLGFQIISLARKMTTYMQNRAGTDNQKPKKISQEQSGGKKKKDYKLVAKAKVAK